MTGTVELSAAELTDVLAAVLEYNGYRMSSLTLTDEGGAVCRVEVPPMEVKVTKQNDADRLRDLLYPEVDTQWNSLKQPS